jgi:hypothetical protein
LHKQQDPIAAPSLARCALKFFHIADRPLIHFADDIRRFDPDLIRRATRLNFDH